MGWIRFLLILLTAFLSPNSAAATTPAANRVVTQIDVTVIADNHAATVTYTDDSQMESILTYLRLTDPLASKQFEPDSFRSDSYTFTVYFNENTVSCYSLCKLNVEITDKSRH